MSILPNEANKHEFINGSLTRKSIVCQGCANDIMDSIWKNEINMNVESLPGKPKLKKITHYILANFFLIDELRSRPFCPDYGKCEAQYENSQETEMILHNQKYRHW